MKNEQSVVNRAWFYPYYKLGKDDGEKLRSEELIPPEKVYDPIDSLSMCRAEIKKQGNKTD